MLLHEVEFLRKRAGVPSQGQVAVCCYSNRGRIFYVRGKSGGSGRAEKKMVSEGRQRGRSFQMEREKSWVSRSGRNASMSMMTEMPFETLCTAIPLWVGTFAGVTSTVIIWLPECRRVTLSSCTHSS